MIFPVAGELPFVGRGDEIASIRHSLDGGGAVIVGPAGAGKSRLLDEVLKDLKDVAVVRAYGSASGRAIPLGAFAPLVRLDGGRPAAGALMRTVIDQLAERAGGRRLVLAVDDAHLLDDASAAVVEQLVRHRRDAVLLTVRDDSAGPAAGILHADILLRLDLGPLPKIGEALTGFLGGPTDNGTIDRFFTASAGNPYVLTEMIRNALATGELAEKDGVWSLRGRPAAGPRLAELMGQRIGRLTDQEQTAMELLAFGEPLGATMLQQAVPARTLEDLEERGLIRVVQDGRRTSVRLAHPLYSDAVRARCPQLRANRRMRDLADAVTSAGARRSNDSLRIASWLLDAGAPAPVDLLVRAARQAYVAFDLPLAQQLSRQALSAGASAAAVPLVASMLLDMRPAEAEELLTDLWPGLDRQSQLALTFLRAQNLALGLGRDEHAIRMLALAEAEPGLSTEVTDGFVVLRLGINFARGHFAEALAETEAWITGGLDREPGRTQLDIGYGTALALAGRPVRGLEVLDDCAPRVAALGAKQPWMLPAYELGRAWTLLFLGRAAESIEVAEQALKRWPGWDLGTIAYGVALAQAHRWAGRVTDAWQALQPALPVVRRSAASRLDAVCLAEGAHLAALRGDTKLATELAAEGRERALPAWRGHGFWLDIARPWVAGDPDQAVRLALRAAEKARTYAATTFELIALHDVVRLGAAGKVADRLAELAGSAEGPLPPLYAAHAAAAVAGDPAALSAVAERFSALGMTLHAAEAMATAVSLFRDSRSAQAAAGRAALWAAECQGARTPALSVPATPTLTARERQIARLAADGLTNQQIAERLSVSRRTVENHLYSAYVKLGTRNREELAALL